MSGLVELLADCCKELVDILVVDFGQLCNCSEDLLDYTKVDGILLWSSVHFGAVLLDVLLDCVVFQESLRLF